MKCSMSARVGLANAFGEEPKWFWHLAQLVIDTIFFFEPDHCLLAAAKYSADLKAEETELHLGINEYVRVSREQDKGAGE